jgi:hypothetical protein
MMHLPRRSNEISMKDNAVLEMGKLFAIDEDMP